MIAPFGAACAEQPQRMALRQDRFVIAPAQSSTVWPHRSWQIPIAIGPLSATPPTNILLPEGGTVIPAGSCGEAIKVNRGDVGYFRVEYGPRSLATLVKSLALMAPDDRVDFVSDSWALVQAGRAGPPSYLALIDQIHNDDHRAVWEQVIGALTRLPHSVQEPS